MPTPQDASSAYLASTRNDPVVYAQIAILWDTYSGIPELLDAGPASTRRYTFSQEEDAYYDTRTGRKITAQQIRVAVLKVSEHQKMEMRKVTQQLVSRIITLETWYTKMYELMNILYRTLFLLSIGGFSEETEEQRESFYLFVLFQFGWIDKFYAQVERGRQALDGSAITRAGLYGEYGNSLYQNLELERKISKGYAQAKRILGPNETHCKDSKHRYGCVELAKRGWVSIGQMVQIGQASCYSNCKCHIVYR